MTDKTFLRHGIRLLLAVLVLIVLAPSAVMAADDWSYPTKKPSNPFGGGNGKKDSPYIISTAQHLANLAYMVNDGTDYDGKYFLQTKDIVLNENLIANVPVKEANGGIRYSKNKDYFDNLKRWQPIGKYGYFGADDFEGIYDGGGHSVSGVYCRQLVNKDIYNYVGLFATCDEAHILNLTIKDSFYQPGHTYSYLGALIGYSSGTSIDNCHAENCVISSDGVTLTDHWCIGGLVGYADGAFSAKKCSFDGIVDIYTSTRKNEYYNIGGIVGEFFPGFTSMFGGKHFSLEDCSTKGTISLNGPGAKDSGYYHIAGMVAQTVNLSSGSKLLRCVNRMDINVLTEEPSNSHDYDWYAFYISGLTISDLGGNGAILECVECANFGNINFGYNSGQELTIKNGDVYIAGLCSYDIVKNCFNYGDINVGKMNVKGDVNIGQWQALSYDGTAPKNCYGYNKMSYACTVVGESHRLRINDGYENCKSYTTVNGTDRPRDIDKASFTSQDYADKLNQDAGTSMYGLIKETGHRFYGYLSLTSIGALANSLVGKGTQEEPYVISNANDLRMLSAMFKKNSFKDNVFKLTADIDMTDEPAMEDVGSSAYPFDGIFDGDGHYIRGLKTRSGSLFYIVTGTVKNLALYDSKNQDGNMFWGLASFVGKDENNCGKIEHCYVSSDATVNVSSTIDGSFVGGICYMLRKGSSISNCYYTGNVKLVSVDGSGSFSKHASVGGIATRADNGASIEQCYAVIGYDAGEDFKSELGGIVAEEGTPTLTGNYYHTDIAATSQQPTVTRNYDGTTSADTYAIKASDLGDAWTEGRYYPVLKSAYHYVCKDSEGKAVALDATGYVPANNEILTLEPTVEQTADTKMWQLPNVAVYSSDLDAEVLTNFNIVPDTGDGKCPLRYKASGANTNGRIVGLAVYPWEVISGVNWQSFCLPGCVSLSDLPEGCELYVGGAYNNTDNTMNIVKVESVPAGVPFLLRYKSKDAGTVYITMSGDMKMTPQQADAASSLKGTFEHVSGSYIHGNVRETTMSGETKRYISNGYMANCFSAYVKTSSLDQINLTDYLLLDEQSNNTSELVDANNGKTVNVKLRRSIKTGGWNTVCLPFSVSAQEIESRFGSGTLVEELADAKYEDGAVVLTFKKADGMTAGKPYLVRPKTNGTIFEFNTCLIDGTATATEPLSVVLGDGSVASISMAGSYGKAYLVSTDDENQYFIQADVLYRATQASPVIMQGFRCWFKVTDASGTKAQMLNAARVVHADGTTTDIKLVDTGLGTTDARVYNLQGVETGEPVVPGVYIRNGKKFVKK